MKGIINNIINKKRLILLAGLVAILMAGSIGVIRSNLIDQENSSNNVLRVINNWYDFAWHWRKPITINNGGGALTNFQIKLTVDTQTLVSAGKMQSSGNDIRFTTSNGVTAIDYWIESGINTASTAIWVKAPSVPSGSSTIYMYYGNPSAAAASNGSNTFLFFDDFNDNSIDTNKWQTYQGSWSETTGIMRQTSTATQDPKKCIAKYNSII